MSEANAATETEASAASAPVEPTLAEFEPHIAQMPLRSVESVLALETAPSAGAPQSNPEAPATPSDAAPTSSATPEPADAPPSPESPDEAAPAVEEPPRPRRRGWWQRARASVIGG
jgi:ribonuclease E